MGLSTSRSEIQWAPVESPRNLLFGDTDHMGFLEAASKIIAEQLYIGNPKSQLCSERYCPIYPCFYRLGEENVE